VNIKGGGTIGYTPGPVVDWNPAAPVFWDDFLTGGTTTGIVGQLGWYVSTTGTASQPTAPANHPGIHRITTGTGSAVAAMLHQANAGQLVSEFGYLKVIISFGTGANVPIKRAGLFFSASNPPQHGVYFECLAADTNWFSVTRENASQTRKDTGIAYNASAYPVFEIAHPSSTLWQFSVNGAVVASHTTGENLPLESRAMFIGYTVVDQGTAVTVDFDYCMFQLKVAR
jgi:hypothetical protein